MQGNLGNCWKCLLSWIWYNDIICCICPNSTICTHENLHFFVYKLYINKAVKKDKKDKTSQGIVKVISQRLSDMKTVCPVGSAYHLVAIDTCRTVSMSSPGSLGDMLGDKVFSFSDGREIYELHYTQEIWVCHIATLTCSKYWM